MCVGGDPPSSLLPPICPPWSLWVPGPFPLVLGGSLPPPTSSLSVPPPWSVWVPRSPPGIPGLSHLVAGGLPAPLSSTLSVPGPFPDPFAGPPPVAPLVILYNIYDQNSPSVEQATLWESGLSLAMWVEYVRTLAVGPSMSPLTDLYPGSLGTPLGSLDLPP